MIKPTQIIEESIRGVNFLSEKTDSGEYIGGMIGPAVATLCVMVILIREGNVKEFAGKNFLSDFYTYYSSFYSGKKIDDKAIVDCMRHSLAHGQFDITINGIKFKSDSGFIELPYEQIVKIQNKMKELYNSILANGKL
jgi:hypothetical protein